MTFTLEQVVPWGRSLDEYRDMFDLSDADLASHIIGCADGPASFNAEATGHEYRVTSVDPIYRLTPGQIRERIDATYTEVLEETRQNSQEFVWSSIGSVEALGRLRMEAMELFLRDYEDGRRQHRYVDAELPRLPFEDTSFDLALCSHFLFLYTEQLTEAFHRAAMDELCRVALEVRVFPLLALDAQPSAHVVPVITHLRDLGYDLSVDAVRYEFQRGGNQMMRVRRPTTTL